MTTHRPANRHLPQRDPMMTNWYLIRATEIRERAIQAVEQQEAANRTQPTTPGRLTRAFVSLRTRLPFASSPLRPTLNLQPATGNRSHA